MPEPDDPSEATSGVGPLGLTELSLQRLSFKSHYQTTLSEPMVSIARSSRYTAIKGTPFCRFQPSGHMEAACSFAFTPEDFRTFISQLLLTTKDPSWTDCRMDSTLKATLTLQDRALLPAFELGHPRCSRTRRSQPSGRLYGRDIPDWHLIDRLRLSCSSRKPCASFMLGSHNDNRASFEACHGTSQLLRAGFATTSTGLFSFVCCRI